MRNLKLSCASALQLNSNSSAYSSASHLDGLRCCADAHGEVKVNAWEAPTQIGKWKEEHVSFATVQLNFAGQYFLRGALFLLTPSTPQIVFLVLGSWGAVIYTAVKTFGGKKEEQPQPAPHAQH